MKQVFLAFFLLKYVLCTVSIWGDDPPASSSSSPKSYSTTQFFDPLVIPELPDNVAVENKREEVGFITNAIEDYNTNFKERSFHASPNNFFITTFNEHNDMATNFTTKFQKPLKLIGNNEICLHQVVFKNTLEIDLGKLCIFFFERQYTLKEESDAEIKMMAHMGDSAFEIIKKLNHYIEHLYVEHEFKRRAARVDLHLNPENFEFHITSFNRNQNVIIPLADNDAYVAITKKDILKSSPKLKLSRTNVVACVNCHTVLIKFEGNIMNFITWNEKPDNESLFTINVDNIPEFTEITLLVDIVEPENYGNKIKPVLKIFTLSKQKDTQTKTFRMEKYDYKMVKKNHFHNLIYSINIKILQENSNINLRQSKNLFRFHLRQI
jgi:hypothetical protein